MVNRLSRPMLSDMFQVLKRWFSTNNERVGAPVVRFLMNFMEEEGLASFLGINHDQLNLLLRGYSNYYFINLDGDIIELVSVRDFGVTMSEKMTEHC